MDLKELTVYLGAAAASDAPIDGREKDLLRHLLQDLGADSAQAQTLVASLPEPFNLQATLNTLQSRELALKVLRALLVISYCDGSFDQEEVPFVTPVVDKFSVTGDELTRAKQQALFFLKLAPPSVKVPPELVRAEQWEAVCQYARQHFEWLRKAFFDRFHQDLKTADEQTCFLAISVGPPSFDISETRERFIQTNPDYFHMDEGEALQTVRDEAERQLRKQWDAAFVDRCSFCYLEAPGKRRDPCPRCGGEYGEAARRP